MKTVKQVALSWHHLLNGRQEGAKAGPSGTYFLQGLAVRGARRGAHYGQ